jgi:hypothetical protein
MNDLDKDLFSVSASFESKDVVTAKLYWEDQVSSSSDILICDL